MIEPLNFDKSVPLLIVKFGSYVLHHGALGAVRSLGRMGVPVYAIVEDRYTPLALSRYLTASFQWSSKAASSEALLDDLRSIAKRLGRPAILLPTDDVAAMFLAQHRSSLTDAFIAPQLDGGLARRLCNKWELYRFCKSAGVACPHTALPRSLQDVQEFMESAVFPVVLKAADAQRLPGGAARTAIANSPRELLTLYRLMDNPSSPNLLLQEFIPHGSEDWVFHGYRNPQNGCRIAFTGRKLRSRPPFAGYTTLGVCRWNENLIAQTESLLETVNYAGIMDLDYRLDHRDGLYKLLDFNPRVGANFRMFEDWAGLDVVRAMHLDLTGRRVRQLPMREGHTLMVESCDLFASLGYMRRGALTVKEWWKSLKAEKELSWYQSDDPVPSFVMWFRLLIRTVVHLPHRLLSSFQRKSFSPRKWWNRFLLYLRTARYLKPVQIFARFRPLPRFNSPGLPPARQISGKWLPPIPKSNAQSEANRFRFLNQEREIRSWNDPVAPKLWLYNLHYFAHVDEELVERWIHENPPADGIGWDPYPTSLRVANWCKWILGGARPRPEVYNSLACQAAWIEKRLEWHLLANHLLANAKALIFAGSLFDGECGARWLKKGSRILSNELPRQILSDGAHVERSPMYHSIILEDLLDLHNLRRGSSVPLPDLSCYAAKMLGWLDQMVHPDGGIAFFNDAALGIASDRESLLEYARRLDIVPTPVELGESGYRRIRSGQTTLIFDAAPLGPSYQPGHGHADALSFEVSRRQQRVLVNSGISTYDEGPERSFQVGTSAHNTLCIDGADQSEMWGAFRVARRAVPFDVHTDRHSFVEGAHNGYQRLRQGVTHRRRIEVANESLVITDWLEGSGEHRIDLLLHLAPGSSPVIHLDSKMKREAIDSNYWMSFNQAVPNQTVIGHWQGTCPVQFKTRIRLG